MANIFLRDAETLPPPCVVSTRPRRTASLHVLRASLFCLAVAAMAWCSMGRADVAQTPRRLSSESQNMSCTEELRKLGAKPIQSGSMLYGCPFKPVEDNLCKHDWFGYGKGVWVSHWMFAVRFADQTELLTELVPAERYPLEPWAAYFGGSWHNTLVGQLTGLFPYELRCRKLRLPLASVEENPEYEIHFVPAQNQATALDMLKYIDEFRAHIVWPGLYNMLEAWGGVNCQQFAVYMARHITGVDVPTQVSSHPLLVPVLWLLSLVCTFCGVLVWAIIYMCLCVVAICCGEGFLWGPEMAQIVREEHARQKADLEYKKNNPVHDEPVYDDYDDDDYDDPEDDTPDYYDK